MVGFKQFIQSVLGSMDNIMVLKEHLGFKYVHNNKQYKDKVFIFKMFVDLVGSGVNLVRCMQSDEDMENYWIIFDHIKCLYNWTTMGSYFGAPCRDAYLQP